MVFRVVWASTLLIAFAIGGCSKPTETGESKEKPARPSLSDDLRFDSTTSVSEQLARIRSNYQTQLDRTTDVFERGKLLQSHTELAMYIVREHPDDPDVPRVLTWVISVNQRNRHANAALEIIKEKYLDSPDIAELVDPSLGKQTLQQLADESPHDNVKGLANYALGMISLRNNDLDGAEQRFKNLSESYAEIQRGGSTLGKLAADMLNLIEVRKEAARIKEQLQVGKVAPDIEGQDTDGVEFKLSDYRGKVVMLSFWGDW